MSQRDTYGAHFYTIVNLNFSVRSRFRRQWPDLEELPECPPHLNMLGGRLWLEGAERKTQGSMAADRRLGLAALASP